MSRPRTLRVTEQAENELADIWAFIAADNPAAATAFVGKLRERFTPLLTHPELGPARDDLSPGLRVLFYRDYASYYRFTEVEVIIVHVTHGARDAAALMAHNEE